jgi:predicted  nucleic acid-binding Zn-ribbon protein
MEEARTLLELQDRDLKIMRLNKQLDDMPEKRAILAARAKIAEIANLLARTEAVGQAVEAAVKKLDDERTALTEKMEHEQGKLLSGAVKNPKELTAISLELDSLKRRREKLENDELAEMAKRDTAAEQAAKVSGILDGGKVKEAQLVAVFRSRGGGIVSEIEQLTAQREKLAATLEGDMCGVCRVSLPAGALESLRGGPELGTCPKCQRLLVVNRP